MNSLERPPDTDRVCDWSDDDFEREERRVKRFMNAMEEGCCDALADDAKDCPTCGGWFVDAATGARLTARQWKEARG